MLRQGKLSRLLSRLPSSEDTAVPSRLWNLPEKVNLYEVGPRDGLQNEKEMVSTETKVELVNRLSLAGFRWIESTSFVSPKWVPQMADAVDVMRMIDKKPGTRYPALLPNIKGWSAAMASGARDIAVFVSASEAFSQKNLNCSISDSLRKVDAIAQLADDAGVPMRGYVSCVVGCPYSGKIEPKSAADMAVTLSKLGCYEVSMGDTTGIGTPAEVTRMFESCLEKLPADRLAAHMHDTYGQGLVNVLSSLSLGIKTIDSSIAGLGGCPFADGAKGNVATEDVVYMLNGLGVNHGINVEEMLNTSQFISEALGKGNGSRAASALLANRP